MKLTITKITRKPITTKYGEKTKVGIQTTERGDVWLGCFETQETQTWKVGAVIEADVTQNGQYWNLTLPKKQETQVSPQLLDEIRAIRTLLGCLVVHFKANPNHQPTEEVVQEAPDEDIPF